MREKTPLKFNLISADSKFSFFCIYSGKPQAQKQHGFFICGIGFLHYCNGSVCVLAHDVMSKSLIHEISRCKYIINYKKPLMVFMRL